jgi:transaldolase
MKIFLDSANIEDIKKAYDMGAITGVTTNPSIISRENRKFDDILADVTSIMVDGPVFAEVLALDAEGMIEEGRALAKKSKNIVVKIPMLPEGLKAVKKLASEGITVCVTVVYSAPQALLAANAGASYVAPFVGRLDDIGQTGINLISEISEIFALHGIQTEIIAASIRNAIHVLDAARAGSHIATVPYKVLASMIDHPLTAAGIQRFLKDWESAQK